MIWVFAAILILIAAPFARELIRPRMTESTRSDAPGKIAKLSQGITHYQWYGPGNGPVLVLIHGLTTPSFVWRSMARALASAGYCVLSYDLYGRGYSDRPKGKQDAEFFLRQLNDLLAHERVGTDLTVVGYSMGGAIATCFAAADADRIRQLVLIAPAGMNEISSGLAKVIRNVPGLGDWLMRAVYPEMLRKGLRAERTPEGKVPGINPLQRAELKTHGFVPAVLSSLRGILSGTLVTEHKTLAAQGIRVLAIWGEKDDLIPVSTMAKLAEWHPNAHQEVIEGAGHGVTYTHSDQVVNIMRGFMKPPPVFMR